MSPYVRSEERRLGEDVDLMVFTPTSGELEELLSLHYQSAESSITLTMNSSKHVCWKS